MATITVPPFSPLLIVVVNDDSNVARRRLLPMINAASMLENADCGGEMRWRSGGVGDGEGGWKVQHTQNAERTEQWADRHA